MGLLLLITRFLLRLPVYRFFLSWTIALGCIEFCITMPSPLTGAWPIGLSAQFLARNLMPSNSNEIGLIVLAVWGVLPYGWKSEV